MFRALAVYNFRVWFFGALVSSLGGWMQTTAMSWVVLTELTHGNASAMGLTTALQFAPALILIPVTGRVVDRFDRRTLLFVTESLLGTIALTIGILLILNVMTLPLMLCCAVVAGTAMAFENPVRQAFVADLVAGEFTVNAVSLSSVQFNMARLAGPALAGVLIAVVGSGWVFVLNAATFLVLIVALAVMRTEELLPRHRDASSANMHAALTYLRRRSDLILLFSIVFVSSAFAVNFAVYAAAMAVHFHEPAWGFGLLTSCYAVGSLTGAIFVARQRTVALRRIVAFTFVVAAAVGFSALMPNFWVYAAVCALCGYAIVTQLANANAYMQTHTDPAIRGRALVIYLAFFTGGTPFGAPLLGWAADAWGPRSAVALVGAAALASALVGLAWLVARRRPRRSERSRLVRRVDARYAIGALRPRRPREEASTGHRLRDDGGPA